MEDRATCGRSGLVNSHGFLLVVSLNWSRSRTLRTYIVKKKVNGLPRQSNQNRMIPCPLSPKGYSRSSTLRIVLQCHLSPKGSKHTIFAPTPIGTPVPQHSHRSGSALSGP